MNSSRIQLWSAPFVSAGVIQSHSLQRLRKGSGLGWVGTAKVEFLQLIISSGESVPRDFLASLVLLGCNRLYPDCAEGSPSRAELWQMGKCLFLQEKGGQRDESVVPQTPRPSLGCSVWLWNQGHWSCKWCWSPLCRAGGLSVGNSCPAEAGEKKAIIGARAHLKYLTSELKNWSLFFPLQKLFGLEPSRPHLLFCNWIEPFVRIFKNNYYKALQEEFWLSSSFHFMLSWHFCSRMNLLWNVCFRLHPPEPYYLP